VTEASDLPPDGESPLAVPEPPPRPGPDSGWVLPTTAAELPATPIETSSSRSTSWIGSYGGCVVLAVLLGAASVPLGALSIAAFATDATGDPVSMDPVHAIVMALVACLAGAAVGGAVAAAVVPRHPSAAIWLAIAVAWPVAIATIPFSARLVGTEYFGGYLCFDTCAAMVDSNDPSATFLGYALTVILPIVFTGIGALVALVIAWLDRRSGHPGVSAVAAGASIVILNIWTMALATAAATALVGGVGIWTYLTRRFGRVEP
jgi:hypothetical protein